MACGIWSIAAGNEAGGNDAASSKNFAIVASSICGFANDAAQKNPS
jgi:hypothetical protein